MVEMVEVRAPEVRVGRRSVEDVPFKDFTSTTQEAWVRERLGDVGLPLDRVSKVKYASNPEGRPMLLGTCDLRDGTVTLYKSLETLPPIAQFGTLVHELAHDCDPFERDGGQLFGSEGNRERAARFVTDVAAQTLETRRFLNGYHRHLAEQLAGGEIDIERFRRETFAILVELRFTNPRHLQQVEAAQGARGGRVPLIYGEVLTEDGFAGVGIDGILLDLMPKIDTREQLENHISELKPRFSQGSLQEEWLRK